MHSSYTKELQGNNKLKIALTKHLKEKKYLEKQLNLTYLMCRQASYSCKQSLLDQTIAFIDSTS